MLTIGIVGCPSTHSPSEEVPVTTERVSALPTNVPTVEAESVTSLVYVKPKLSDDELREGWISLFDGTTLFGWDVPSETNWRVKDGPIVVGAGTGWNLMKLPFWKVCQLGAKLVYKSDAVEVATLAGTHEVGSPPAGHTRRLQPSPTWCAPRSART